MSNIDEMLAEHVRVESLLCGAKSVPVEVRHTFSGSTTTQVLTCTLTLGHEPELHADRRCCYATHRFAVVAKRVIEDWSLCAKCQDRWPCAAVLVAMAYGEKEMKA